MTWTSELTQKLWIAVALCLLVVSRGSAQTEMEREPDPSKVRVRIGPLSMNPTIELQNLGVDTNVFNDPPDKNPKRDFTFTLSPKADLWLHLGRTLLSGNVVERTVWFQKYSSQRSAGGEYKIGWRVPLNRVSFNVNAAYLGMRDRKSVV